MPFSGGLYPPLKQKSVYPPPIETGVLGHLINTDIERVNVPMGNKYKDYLVLGLIGVLYNFAVIKATISTMHVPVNVWQMLLFAFLAFLFYTFINTKVGGIAFLSAVGLLFAYSIYLLIQDGLYGVVDLFSPVTRLIQVMMQIGMGYYNDSITNGSLMMAIGVYSLIISMPIYYFLIRYFKYYLLMIPGIAVFMVVWGTMRHVEKLSFFIFSVIAVVLYIRHRNLEQRKTSQSSFYTSKGGGISGGVLVYFVPLAFAIVMLASILPVREMPIEWEWMDKKIYNAWSDINSWFKVDRYDVFSLAKTGFGTPTNLGGPVNPDDTLVMLVKAPSRVYLRGAVYDTYTGSGWDIKERSENNYQNDRFADHRELLYGWKALMINDLEVKTSFSLHESAMPKNPAKRDIYTFQDSAFPKNSVVRDINFLQAEGMPGFLKQLYPDNKLEIEYRQLRTKMLFTPLKLLLPITGLSSEHVLNESIDGIFYSNKRLREGSRYNIDFIQPAYGMPELEEFMSSSWNGAYRSFHKSVNYLIDNLKKHGIDNYNEIENELNEVLDVFALLEKRRDEIHEIYLQIPDSITDRVLSLAESITRSQSTDYGRVKAIEAYLRRNFNYTLSPDIPPRDQDFIEYFLFDGKEGYCSYFASAMCILTRAIGIPARYVEGFVLPETAEENGYFYVKNNNAHAWVEVYLEGVGWVTFEPTPPMTGAMDYYISLSETLPGNNPDNETTPDVFEPDEEIPDDEDQSDWEAPANDPDTSDVPVMLILTIAVIVLWIINMLYIAIKRVVIKLMPQKKSIALLYNYAVSLLEQAGYSLSIGETPMDYATRVDEYFMFEGMQMKEMVAIYYSVRFGSKTIDKKSFISLVSFIKELKKRTGRDMHFIKRAVYRGLLFNG